MAKLKPYAATDANLLAHGLAPAMRWLIAVALDGSTMTYGELGTKLENEAGFSTIFRTRLGFVAGVLMHTIQQVAADAPLINVLVVNQKDRQPSRGAGPFMAKRFGENQLEREDSKQRLPRLWERSFKRAAGEVYKLSATEWADLYRRVFGTPLNADAIERDRRERKRGTEKDGIPTGRNYGAGGEGPYHKALRLWVKDNPGMVDKAFSAATAETEVDLDSGDRIDVVYKLIDRTIVVEVKSRISNEIDLRRGVFQCVKYRAVRQAMDVRDNVAVEAFLVTENELPGEIAALVKLHGIRHLLAPLERN
ncbi:hypothetical protein [Mesorhizobium helmanticense]|uniref:Uncharacterized protein n=1 Tax=Mesorhizobium helmanticense TaxID=1776423 RepID=A0A2T4J1J6_9HYPH|nr:hypothetical protein [Mesorhizobium helmanticense]PTE11770.1 hypothetical protein C9427_03520 [Mesorhizobium helmanticense]